MRCSYVNGIHIIQITSYAEHKTLEKVDWYILSGVEMICVH